MQQDMIRMILWIVVVASYILGALPLYVMGQKTNQENPWFAFIPILNIVLLFQIGGVELWMLLLMLVPCVNLFVLIYAWMKAAEAMNKSSVWGVLMIVPGLNFIIPFYLAFG